MATIVHFEPADKRLLWKLHAWQGNSSWDLSPIQNGKQLDFTLPAMADLRKLRFKFRSIDQATNIEEWEPDASNRVIRIVNPDQIWTFSESPRVLYNEPYPSGTTFKAGDILTLQVFTQNQYRGGQIYVWNPYEMGSPTTRFSESTRIDQAFTSTFSIVLAPWMIKGFHFKLTKNEIWEPDASTRVWRPGDGASLWLKAGQVSVRHEPLAMIDLPIEVLVPATSPDPILELIDPFDDYSAKLSSTANAAYPASSRFRVVNFTAQIFPDAAYNVQAFGNLENPSFTRPFPADPDNLGDISRMALGVDGWLATFPSAISSITLVIEPAASSLSTGLDVEVSLGNAQPYQKASATRQQNGQWQVSLDSVPGIKSSIQLLPINAQEPRIYDWIDTSRFLVPPAAPTTFYTTEGVFGFTTSGPSVFSEPQSRQALMEAAFGTALLQSGVFGDHEMPHGATQIGSDTCFVIHAPHAVTASLILVDENAPGYPARKPVAMTLTNDRRYWWCQIPAAAAPPSTRYRFKLNDDTEVLDPAAREILDRELWETSPDDDPSDPKTSWSLVLDVAAVQAEAHRQQWQTMGWESLLVYEIHARRFTDINPGSLMPLALLADELRPVSRNGQQGYLNRLPATAFELLPVHEFKSDASWGYNPACYFAIDSSYGGAKGLAEFVNTAHQNERGVVLDVVYNHSLDSPLMKIAHDVYRNGDAYGDRMNCGHPMVLEFLRQATIYLWRTFGIDGFRFDDTKTIVSQCQNGWEFLGAIRSAVRAAASAEGLAWQYCVAENDPKVWDIPNPGWGVLDGEWAIDEVFRILDASYSTWQDHGGVDNASDVKKEMDNPSMVNRPFSIAMRYGESHDIVSGQNPANKRIAARPPFGQGLQLAKALGTLTLLSNGVPMLFMGQEVGETRFFSFDNNGPVTNPQASDLPPTTATDQTRVLAWFRSIMGLRNDASKGLRGDGNYQVVRTAENCGIYVWL